MPQANPFVIKGIANLNGTLQSGITVTIKNNTKNQTGTWTTDSAGEFAASLSDPVQFLSGYDISDSITVSCSYLSQTITVPDVVGPPPIGGQEVDLIAQSISETGSESYSYIATIPLIQTGSENYSYAATIPLTEASIESSVSGTVSLTESSPEGFSYVVTIPITETGSEAGASATQNMTETGAQSFSYSVTIPLTQTGSEMSVSATQNIIQAGSEGFSYSITIPLTQTSIESSATATQNLTQIGSAQAVVSNITFTLTEISGESLIATALALSVNLTETGFETSFVAKISLPLTEVAAETSSITNIAFPLIEIAAETAQTGLANITELAGTSLTWMATIRLTQTASQLFSYSATIPLTEVSLQNRQVTNVLIPLAEIAAENGYAATFSITEWALERPTVQQIHVIITKTVMLTGQKGAVTLTGEKGSNVVLKGKKGAVKLD